MPHYFRFSHPPRYACAGTPAAYQHGLYQHNAECVNDPPFGRYEKYPVKDCALLMTSADDFFWTFEQAVSYYRFAVVNYIGFHDRGMILAGGCGDTNGKPQIDKTCHLQEAYEFGKHIYPD